MCVNRTFCDNFTSAPPAILMPPTVVESRPAAKVVSVANDGSIIPTSRDKPLLAFQRRQSPQASNGHRNVAPTLMQLLS
jgi:hypothetical protein